MNMRSSVPPRASVIAFSFGIRSLIATSVSLMNTRPRMSTESCSGVLSCWSRLLAWVCGRSSGTPTVNSGADTMKMISSTSITSTIGVTLISAITARRRPRRPPPGEPAMFIAMICSSSRWAHTYRASRPFVDPARQDRGKFVGEPFQPLGLPIHLGGELIVEDSRRNGSDKADCRGKQRLRNARGHHRERGVLRGSDRLEARHDAPDSAEQADERARRTDRRQHQQAAFQPLDFPGDGDVHDLFDPHLKPGERPRLAFERLFEAIHGALGARIQERLVDRDRPYPDRTGQQPQHDRFHDPVSLKEKRDQRYVGGCQRQGCLSHVGRIHKRYPLNASVPNPPGANGCRFHSRAPDAAANANAGALLCRMGGPPKPRLASAANMSKQGPIGATLRL